MADILYSYVVDHDHGLSPNPSNGFCTLVHCKFSKDGKRKNIVELAGERDWILGTGGQSPDSAGNGRIIYLMRVDEKLPFSTFLSDPRFLGRADQCDHGDKNTFALVSKHFFYFGRNAIPVSSLPEALSRLRLEKKGPAYRADFTPKQVRSLTSWFENNVKPGIHGQPCAPITDQDLTTLLKGSLCDSCCWLLRCK